MYIYINIYIYRQIDIVDKDIYSISLGTDPPSSKPQPNPAIFSVPSGTKKLNKSPQGNKKP